MTRRAVFDLTAASRDAGRTTRAHAARGPPAFRSCCPAARSLCFALNAAWPLRGHACRPPVPPDGSRTDGPSPPRHCYKPPRLRARQLRHVALGAGFLQVGVPVTSSIISIWVLGRSDKKGRGRRAPSSCCVPSRTPPWAAAATGSLLLVTHGSCDMAQRLLRDLAAEHLQSTQQGGEQKPGRARAPLPAPGDQQLLPEAGAEASPSEQGFKG